LLITCS